MLTVSPTKHQKGHCNWKNTRRPFRLYSPSHQPKTTKEHCNHFDPYESRLLLRGLTNQTPKRALQQAGPGSCRKGCLGLTNQTPQRALQLRIRDYLPTALGVSPTKHRPGLCFRLTKDQTPQDHRPSHQPRPANGSQIDRVTYERLTNKISHRALPHQPTSAAKAVFP